MSQVLIVDDEPLLREELAEALEMEGFDVATADSVPDALSKMDGASFDTVVTDLKMPKLGGLDLLERLNKDNFKGIVVVVSGHGAKSSRDNPPVDLPRCGGRCLQSSARARASHSGFAQPRIFRRLRPALRLGPLISPT